MNSRLDVALVTCRRLPEPDPDARPLSEALAAAGIRHAVRAWDDETVDWSRARLTLLRSCWNYPRHASRFLAWAGSVARVSRLLNPFRTVRWNLHKGYLLELRRRGVPTVPTQLVERGTRASLVEILRRHGWERAVVKPAISAASLETILVTPDVVEEGQRHLERLTQRGDVLVQPYLESVEGYGERAVVMIEGKVTHAVRKNPRFSGQDERVSDEAVPIAPAEEEVALRASRAAGGPFLYARADLAPGPDGEPLVMELELIEPSLFFRQGPAALESLVAGLRRRLEGLV
ncbi:MAG: hypothetical protein D6718_05085 [Acidobacteria bacterium]|nr:MAG: hypothetical protein D6718_05085 [Acidobacteriota bacterium]